MTHATQVTIPAEQLNETSINPVKRSTLSGYRQWLHLTLVMLCCALVTGCGGSHPRVDTLQVSAETPSVTAGVTTQLRAVETNFLKESMDATALVTWSSSNPSVATVSASGLLSGLLAGTTQITAARNGAIGSLTMTIGSPTVTALSLSPNVASLYNGGTQQYVLNATYANHTTGTIASGVAWAVTPTSVATVSSAGLLTTVAPGNFILSATIGSQSATAIGSVSDAAISSLTITPGSLTLAPGATQQFRAVANYMDNSTRDLTDAVIWTSNNSSVLTIDSKGLGSAVTGSNGSVIITAEAGETSATASVQVGALPSVTSLVIEPTSSSIATGTAEEHKATATYSDGTQRDVTDAVTWSVVDGTGASSASHTASLRSESQRRDTTNAILSVNHTGIDSAMAPGTTTLQASLGAAQSQSVVIVTSATPVSIAIRASHSLFPVGANEQLQLIGTFSDGSTQDISLTANWQSSNPAVATIDSAGLAMGIGAGAVQFSATFAGLNTSTGGFEVLSKNIASTSVIVPYPAIPHGASERIGLLATYTDGSTHDLSSLATWQSSDSSILSVDRDGFVFAQGHGTAQLTATVDGISAIASVLAINSTLQTLTVQPSLPQLARGTTLAFTALGLFSDGALADVTEPVVWTSSDPSVLTIDGAGRAKSGRIGTVKVTATLLGLSQTSADVQVTNASLVSLRISADAAQLASGTGQLYKATGLFSDGTSQDVSSDVLWNVSDWNKASVDADGTVRAMAPGNVQVSAVMQGITASQSLVITSARMLSVSLSPGNGQLPIGLTRQYSLTASFSDGTQQNISRDAIWSTPTPAIATVILKGEVIGLGLGVGQITARYGYFSDSTPVNITNATLASIALTPASTSIPVGAQQLITATGTFSDGYSQNLDGNVVFDAADPAVARVFNSHGLVSAVGVGSTQVSATFRGITATTSRFDVKDIDVSSINLTAARPTITAGGTDQFTATAMYADGTVADLTGQVAWTSSNPTLVTIDANGLATALASNPAGNVTITATYRGVTANYTLATQPSGSSVMPTPPTPNAVLARVTVVPTSSRTAAGTGVQFSLRGFYSDGNSQDLTSYATWTSQDTMTATVSASGVATGLHAGVVSIQGQVSTFTGAATLVVSPATLTSLAISPSGANLATGVAQAFTLTGFFSDGSEQNLSSSAVWTSTSPNVATISSNGVVTALSPGSVAFTATYQGQTVTSAVVQVSSASLLSISVSPVSPTFAQNTTQEFKVTGNYTDGSTHDLTKVASYTSSNPSVLTVDADGLATGLTSGSAYLTISFAGQSIATGTITVSPATPVSLAITPSNPSFANGTSQQFTAVATFSDGSTQDLSKQVVWTSSDASVITIDGTGMANAIAVGSARVGATFNGVSAVTGAVQVTPATVISLSLSPMTLQLAKGTSQQFILTGTFSDGSTQDLSQLASWTSSNPAVISVDGTGLALATGLGSAQIRVTYGTLHVATDSLRSTSATLISISTVPASPTIAAGTTEQITVTGIFSDASMQDLTGTASFTSSNPLVASVNAQGLLIGSGVGTTTLVVTANGLTTRSQVTITNAVLSSIAITPVSPVDVAKGSRKQFTATGTYSDGTTQDLSSLVTWTSTNPAVLTIDHLGLATGVGLGSASITSSYGGQTATTGRVDVIPATLASISVTAPSANLVVGSTQQLSVIGTYTDGSVVDLTAQATWTSSNVAVASINAAGLVTAVADGTTTILGQINGVSNTIVLTVSPDTQTVSLLGLTVTPALSTIAHGAAVQFTATGTYTDGSIQNLTALTTWTSTDATVATIANTGLAQGVAAGTVTIGASYQGVSGGTTLTVTAPPVTLVSIALTPSNGSITLGNVQQFTLTGTYSDGTTQNLTAQATFASSVPAVATVNTAGEVTPISAGATQIWAMANGQRTAVSLTVSAAPLVSLSVTPQTTTLAVGTRQQYKAIGVFADGSSQDLTESVVWSSDHSSTASINTVGLAIAQGVGTASISATSGAIHASASLSATSAVATSVQLSPANPSLPAGGTLQLVAIATFTDGSSQDASSSVTYTSLDPGVVTVDSTGHLHAVGAGTASIQAIIGSASTTILCTVTPASLTSIDITPASLNLAAGMSQQLIATGSFTDGSTQDLTGSVVWASSDLSVATISPAGNITVANSGNVTITANNNGISGSKMLVTTNAVATAIAVTPASVTLAAGQTQQFIATAILSDGSQQTITSSAHWAVTNPSIGTVTDGAGNGGLLTTNSPGTLTVSANFNSISGNASVTIQPASIATLAISPNPVSLPAGTNVTLSIMGRYTDGSTANLGSSAVWTSANPSVAIVDANGVLSATGVGTTMITGAVNGTRSSVPVTVTSAVLQSIQFSPTTISVAAGLQTQLLATGVYSDGSSANITSQVQWTSSSPATVTISGTGLITGVSAGSANLAATLGPVQQVLPVSVTAAVLQSIIVQAPSAGFALGQSLQLSASGLYSDGSTRDITSAVAWTSQSTGIGIVGASGIATGVSIGNFNAVATKGSVSGSFAVSVTAALLQSITITPADTAIVNILGRSVQYTATGHFSDGSSQNLTTSVHWAISAGISVGSISSAGVFSPLGLGLGTISATSASVIGTTGFLVVSVL